MSYGYIYKIQNLLNDKVYIGQKQGEFNPDYMGSGLLIRNAINKYGRNNFKLEVIVYAEDKDKLNELEKHYISEYKKIFESYNIAEGGKGGWAEYNRLHPKFGSKNGMYGRKHSQESIQKMKLNQKGKIVWNKGLTKETDERLVELGKKCVGNRSRLGKPHTEETRKKMSESRKNYFLKLRGGNLRLVI